MQKSFNENYSFNTQSAPAGPCVPGALRLFVDVEGNFFPCEHVSETSEVMKIGNLNDGFYVDKVNTLLNVAKLTESSCRKCWAYHQCYQCAKFCDNDKTLSREMRRIECSKVKRNLQLKLKYYIMLNEVMECKNDKLKTKEGYNLSI